MTERECICFDCKHQDGTWVNECEVDIWCTLNKTNNCEKTFECKYFEEL